MKPWWPGADCQAMIQTGASRTAKQIFCCTQIHGVPIDIEHMFNKKLRNKSENQPGIAQKSNPAIALTIPTQALTCHLSLKQQIH